MMQQLFCWHGQGFSRLSVVTIELDAACSQFVTMIKT